MAVPDFIVLGHVVQDLVPGGWRLGGTAAFAAVQAQRLGLSVGVVTRKRPDLNLDEWLPGVEIAGRASSHTTAFENVYDGGMRRQRVLRQAEPLQMDDVPDEWRSAPVVLLGPVCGEMAPGFGESFAESLTGVAAQGWLRRVTDEQRVERCAWDGPAFWSGCDALFVSDEDIEGRKDQVDQWAAELPIVAMTRYRAGARLHSSGRWHEIDAFPTNEVDPTGAGDVFAAAFLVRYHETADDADATRFASAAAACSVEGVGIEGIADRSQVDARMREHPEVALR